MTESVRDWLAFKTLDLSDWTSLGPKPTESHHLWKREPASAYDMWATVTDDFESWEFRECVLCGVKQIREFPS